MFSLFLAFSSYRFLQCDGFLGSSSFTAVLKQLGKEYGGVSTVVRLKQPTSKSGVSSQLVKDFSSCGIMESRDTAAADSLRRLSPTGVDIW